LALNDGVLQVPSPLDWARQTNRPLALKSVKTHPSWTMWPKTELIVRILANTQGQRPGCLLSPAQRAGKARVYESGATPRPLARGLIKRQGGANGRAFGPE